MSTTPTPTEARWLANNGATGPAASPHPMSYTRIQLTISPGWADAGEEAVIRRLAEILRGTGESSSFPFARDTGLKWQLDGGNDWWAELTVQPREPGWPPGDRHLLTITHRYGTQFDQRLRSLAEWAAVVFQGRVLHPTISGYQMKGGEWVAAARRWMQSRFRNGSDVTWGSHDRLEGGPVTVADIEEVAALAAAGALNERNAGRI